MKGFLAIVLAVLLSACVDDADRPDWVSAPEVYECSEAQMVVVDRETKNCVDNTDYLGRYCYGLAIMRRCSLPASNLPDLPDLLESRTTEGGGDG